MSQESEWTSGDVRTRFKEPRKYKVILYNDDFTTFDFVEMMLMQVFRKSREEASQLAMRVHRSGRAVAGIYSYDIALSRRRKALQLARTEGFPLRLDCVPADMEE